MLSDKSPYAEKRHQLHEIIDYDSKLMEKAQGWGVGLSSRQMLIAPPKKLDNVVGPIKVPGPPSVTPKTTLRCQLKTANPTQRPRQPRPLNKGQQDSRRRAENPRGSYTQRRDHKPA